MTSSTACVNAGEVIWKLWPDIRSRNWSMFLSECLFNFDFLEGVKWKCTLWLVKDALSASLFREGQTDDRQESVEVEFDIGLFTTCGDRFVSPTKKRKNFGKSGSYRFIRLAGIKQLLDETKNLLFWGDCITVFIRMWPVGSSLPNSLILFAGFTARKLKTVPCSTAVSDTKEIESFWQDEFKVVISFKDRNIHVKLSKTFYATVLLKEIRIFKYPSVEEVYWSGIRFASGDDCISFIDERECLKKFKHCVQIKAVLEFYHFGDISLTRPSVCHATDNAISVEEASPANPSTSAPEKRDSSTSTLPPAESRNMSTITDPPPRAKNARVQTNAQVSTDSLGFLASGFTELLDNGNFSDFTLRVGQDSLRVHRSILSAASPVFRALLTSPMIEASNNEVDVVDYHVDTVRRMVQYMYAGAVPDLDPSNAVELFSLADMYGLLALRDHCLKEILSPGISRHNVCSILSLADKHWMEDVKKRALEYIRLNPSAVFLSTEWADFMKNDPVLALEVYHTYYVKRIRR